MEEKSSWYKPKQIRNASLQLLSKVNEMMSHGAGGEGKECHVQFDASMQNKREHHMQLSMGSCLGAKLQGARKENMYGVALLLAAGL